MKFTSEIIAEILTANIKKVLAAAFGVNTDTVGAWARSVASDSNPNGTGKHNPLDQAERYIRVAHRYNPGNAREAAHYFVGVVNELDRQAGIHAAECEDAPCHLLAQSVLENADVVFVLAAEPNNPKAWLKARTEIQQAVAKLQELDGCLEKLLSEVNR